MEQKSPLKSKTNWIAVATILGAATDAALGTGVLKGEYAQYAIFAQAVAVLFARNFGSNIAVAPK